VERYDGVLPHRAPDVNPWWNWAKPLPGGETLLIALANGELWRFDPRLAPDWQRAFTYLTTVGNISHRSHIGLALAWPRLFYLQGPDPSTIRSASQDVHLRSINLDPRSGYALRDHGLVTDQDGRRPYRLPAMSSDGQRVYLTGDWFTLAGEPGSLSREGQREGPGELVEVNRIQCFAVASAE
jgi:hypothetical protein